MKTTCLCMSTRSDPCFCPHIQISSQIIFIIRLKFANEQLEKLKRCQGNRKKQRKENVNAFMTIGIWKLNSSLSGETQKCQPLWAYSAPIGQSSFILIETNNVTLKRKKQISPDMWMPFFFFREWEEKKHNNIHQIETAFLCVSQIVCWFCYLFIFHPFYLCRYVALFKLNLNLHLWFSLFLFYPSSIWSRPDSNIFAQTL